MEVLRLTLQLLGRKVLEAFLLTLRKQLLRLLPVAGADAHAVEVAIGRLRSALGARELIVTVVKRGYRLAVD